MARFHKSFEDNKLVDYHDKKNGLVHTVELGVSIKANLANQLKHHAVQKFEQVDCEYAEKYGLPGKIKRYKENGYKMFINAVEDGKVEMWAADQLCANIASHITMSIERDMSRKITHHILNLFAHSKFHVMAKVLD